jgi:hypothetical protein
MLSYSNFRTAVMATILAGSASAQSPRGSEGRSWMPAQETQLLVPTTLTSTLLKPTSAPVVENINELRKRAGANTCGWFAAESGVCRFSPPWQGQVP